MRAFAYQHILGTALRRLRVYSSSERACCMSSGNEVAHRLCRSVLVGRPIGIAGLSIRAGRSCAMENRIRARPNSRTNITVVRPTRAATLTRLASHSMPVRSGVERTGPWIEDHP